MPTPAQAYQWQREHEESREPARLVSVTYQLFNASCIQSQYFQSRSMGQREPGSAVTLSIASRSREANSRRSRRVRLTTSFSDTARGARLPAKNNRFRPPIQLAVEATHLVCQSFSSAQMLFQDVRKCTEEPFDPVVTPTSYLLTQATKVNMYTHDKINAVLDARAQQALGTCLYLVTEEHDEPRERSAFIRDLLPALPSLKETPATRARRATDLSRFR
eukprot:6197657-Pleurochrysis_carterae.AAC.13